jgi:malate dehydrogenase (oxaloacetate-decarboxylating)
MADSAEEKLARAAQPARDALRLHARYRGKVQVLPKCPIADASDFAVWYTPGVAAPCRAIQADPECVFEHTNKGNCIAVVSDGSRVLGLGDIGPEAGLPVMEGKALLFKYLGGVDAVPLCLRTRDADELIRVVECLEPSFGGINLEDIAQPKCFRVLDRLRARMGIPVWHDDQQGTATVLLAALRNALQVVGKDLRTIRIAMIGMGAANVAVYRILRAAGIERQAVVACDRDGILHRQRVDFEAHQDERADQWRVCLETNGDDRRGGVAEALHGADVCVAFSAPGPDLIRPEWVQTMARDAIVFACANPVPEIWPWDATSAGARIVATGRSDFPNQVNNSLAFPGIFRGALDVRARAISDEMARAAADELARCAAESSLHERHIVPAMDDPQVAPRVAVATALAAQRQGLAAVSKPADQLRLEATAIIGAAREATRALIRSGVIRDRHGEG